MRSTNQKLQVRTPTISDTRYTPLVYADADLLLCSLGYEERCTAIPQELPTGALERTVVLEFAEMEDDDLRKANTAAFDSIGLSPSLTMSADSDVEVLQLLEARLSGRSNPYLVVDYSAMSRVWYDAILNWMWHSPSVVGGATIDFVYSRGKYAGADGPLVLESLDALRGAQGITRPGAPSVLCLVLGFDASAIWSAYQALQPDTLICAVGIDVEPHEDRRRVLEVNKEVRSLSSLTVDLPVYSIEESYRILASLFSSATGGSDVTILPFGPKPLTLASILLSHRFRDVRCLRPKRRPRVERIQATDGRLATRVSFPPSNAP